MSTFPFQLATHFSLIPVKDKMSLIFPARCGIFFSFILNRAYRMSKKHSNLTTVKRRRAMVEVLYLQNYTLEEIATKTNSTVPAIRRDLSLLRKEWLRSNMLDLNEARARELAKIDRLEFTYWQSWQKSMGTRTETVTRTPDGEVREKVWQEDGNIAYLEGVRRCIDKRCDLLGLDARRGALQTNEKETNEETLNEKEIDRKIEELITKTRGNGQTRKNGNRSELALVEKTAF